MTNHNSSDPPSTWRALCAEAEAIVIRGEKFLLLDEEMTFRMGEALELAAGVLGTPARSGTASGVGSSENKNCYNCANKDKPAHEWPCRACVTTEHWAPIDGAGIGVRQADRCRTHGCQNRGAAVCKEGRCAHGVGGTDGR